jgi:regulator of sirC expression with transglutaminase-like and TPR domain
MKRRSLLVLLATGACRPARPQRLSERLLNAARAHAGTTEEELERAEAELGRIAELARTALADAAGASTTSVLTQLLFRRLGFVREVEKTDLGFVLLPSVLTSRRGSCVGLGTLFLALAEALELPAAGVMMPGHFYVRVRERGRAQNVELLRSGEAMSNDWYAGRFPVPAGGASEYQRPLSEAEVLGVLDYNVGNERRRQLRLPEARAAFAGAVAQFPDFTEAHASLGAVEQLLGHLDSAATSYAAARSRNPSLPGLADNIAVLDAERAKSAAATPKTP